MELTFIEKKKEAQNAYSFIFDTNSNIRWKAGEYILLNLPHHNIDERGDERPFSISSAPSEGFLMITTRYFEDKASTFKKELFHLKKGDVVSVKKEDNPDNTLYAQDIHRDYVFLVAGIGITPMRSIIKEYHIQREELKGILLYANRNEEYIFGEEIDNLSKGFRNFTVRPYHDKRIDREVLESMNSIYNKPIFLISGTYEFVNSMKSTLISDLKVHPSDVKSTSFGKDYLQSSG
jgi:ferredoxin-NADP reductase